MDTLHVIKLDQKRVHNIGERFFEVYVYKDNHPPIAHRESEIDVALNVEIDRLHHQIRRFRVGNYEFSVVSGDKFTGELLDVLARQQESRDYVEDNLKRVITEAQNKSHYLEERLKTINKTSFWNRVLFLFGRDL